MRSPIGWGDEPGVTRRHRGLRPEGSVLCSRPHEPDEEDNTPQIKRQKVGVEEDYRQKIFEPDRGSKL